MVVHRLVAAARLVVVPSVIITTVFDAVVEVIVPGIFVGGTESEVVADGVTQAQTCFPGYAIDVGYGQLAWKLRCDERVVNLERTNFRYITAEQLPQPLQFASVDVSFISLSVILPVLSRFMRPDGHVVCLIKPQFEAGREKVGKKGVVRDKAVHIEVIEKIVALMPQSGFTVLGLDYSPVKGPEGNIEYLIYAGRNSAEPPVTNLNPAEVVTLSHRELDR